MKARGLTALVGPNGCLINAGAAIQVEFDAANPCAPRVPGEFRFSEIYPGTDVLYYRNEAGEFEFDFIVKPGADPSQIALRFGGRAVESGPDGALVVGPIRLAAPRLFQVTAHGRHEISGRYALRNSREVEFLVGPEYDPTLELVIDPVVTRVEVATRLGGSLDDVASDVATGPSGNAIVVGSTRSPNFPVTGGVVQPAFGGTRDLFVTAFSSNGNSLVFSTFLGGSGNEGSQLNGPDEFCSIALDGNGAVFVGGASESTNYPTTAGVFGLSQTSPFSDGVISILSEGGDQLFHSTYFGDPNSVDEITDIAREAGTGDILVTGITLSSGGFPVTNAFQPNSAGGSDYFVARFAPALDTLVFSTYFGSPDVDLPPCRLALEPDGTINLAGSGGPGLIAVGPAFQTVFGGGTTDGLLARLSFDGASLLTAGYLGGNQIDRIFDIAYSNGDVYVTGFTLSPNFPITPGVIGSTPSTNAIAFATRLSATTPALGYSTFAAGGGGQANALEPDAAGNLWLDGWARLNTNATALALPPTARPPGESVSVLGTDRAFICGQVVVGGDPFTPTSGAFQTAAQGGSDAYLVRLVATNLLAPTAAVVSNIFTVPGDLSGDGAGDLLTQKGSELFLLSTGTNKSEAQARKIDVDLDGKIFGANQVFLTSSNTALTNIVFYLVTAKGPNVESIRVQSPKFGLGQITTSDGPKTRIKGKVVATGDFNVDSVIDLVVFRSNKLYYHVSESPTQWADAELVNGFERKSAGVPIAIVSDPFDTELICTKAVAEIGIVGAIVLPTQRDEDDPIRLSSGPVGLIGNGSAPKCPKGTRAVTTVDGRIVCIKKKGKKFFAGNNVFFDASSDNVGSPVGPK